MQQKRLTEVSSKWSASGINLDAAEVEARRLEKKGSFTATIDDEQNTVTLSKDDFKTVMGKLGNHKRSAKSAKKNVLLLAFGYLAVTIGFIAVIVGLVNWRLEATKDSHVVDSTLVGRDGTTVETSDVQSYAQLFDLPHFEMNTIKNIKDLVVTLEDERQVSLSVTRAVKSSGTTRLQLEDANGNGVDIDACANLALVKLDGELFRLKGMDGSRNLASSASPRLYTSQEYAALRTEQRELGEGSADVGTALLTLRAAEAVLDTAKAMEQPRDWQQAYINSEVLYVGESGQIKHWINEVFADRSEAETEYRVSINEPTHRFAYDTKLGMLYEWEHDELKACESLDTAFATDFVQGPLSMDFDVKDCNEDGFVIDTSYNGNSLYYRTQNIDFRTANQDMIDVPTFEACYEVTQAEIARQNLRNSTSVAVAECQTVDGCGVPVGYAEAEAAGRNLQEEKQTMLDRSLAAQRRRRGRGGPVANTAGFDGESAPDGDYWSGSNTNPNLKIWGAALNAYADQSDNFDMTVWATCDLNDAEGSFSYCFPMMVFAFRGAELFELEGDANVSTGWQQPGWSSFHGNSLHGGVVGYVQNIEDCYAAYMDVLNDAGIVVDYFSGHSLGAACAVVWGSHYYCEFKIVAFGGFPTGNPDSSCTQIGTRFSVKLDPIGGGGSVSTHVWADYAHDTNSYKEMEKNCAFNIGGSDGWGMNCAPTVTSGDCEEKTGNDVAAYACQMALMVAPYSTLTLAVALGICLLVAFIDLHGFSTYHGRPHYTYIMMSEYGDIGTTADWWDYSEAMWEETFGGIPQWAWPEISDESWLTGDWIESFYGNVAPFSNGGVPQGPGEFGSHYSQWVAKSQSWQSGFFTNPDTGYTAPPCSGINC